MSKYKNPHHTVTKTRPNWFIPALVVVAMVVVVGLVLVANRPSQPTVDVNVSGKPNLVVDKSTVDFGDVHFGKPVTAVFTVSNTGDQPLQILRQPQLEVLQGCCPPQVVASSSTINPGGTVTLTVQFAMHEGMGGQHEFLIHLLTNDPAQSEAQLRIFSNWIA